jgi:hypothetical protein
MSVGGDFATGDLLDCGVHGVGPRFSFFRARHFGGQPVEY